MEDLRWKAVFGLYLFGALFSFSVPEINFFYYTLGFFGIAIVGYFLLENLHDSSIEEKRINAEREAEQKAREAEFEAEQKAREEMLAAMTPEQRQALAEQEKRDRELQKREAALWAKEAKLRDLENDLIAAANALEAQESNQSKVPLSAKVATTAVAGYKIGKSIGRM